MDKIKFAKLVAWLVKNERLFKAMAENRKIDAIKEYRVITGVGLKEAKDAVEAVMRQ